MKRKSIEKNVESIFKCDLTALIEIDKPIGMICVKGKKIRKPKLNRNDSAM